MASRAGPDSSRMGLFWVPLLRRTKPGRISRVSGEGSAEAETADLEPETVSDLVETGFLVPLRNWSATKRAMRDCSSAALAAGRGAGRAQQRLRELRH